MSKRSRELKKRYKSAYKKAYKKASDLEYKIALKEVDIKASRSPICVKVRFDVRIFSLHSNVFF